MTCARYRDLIAAHVDGLLSPADQQEVTQHLKTCAACAQLFAQESRFHTAFAARQFIVSVPTEVERRLQSALAVEQTQSPSWWERFFSLFPQPRLALGFAAAGLVVVFLLSQLFFSAPEQDVFAQALDSYQAVTEGRTPLDYRTEEPAQLQAAFNNSGQIDFLTQVSDLRPAGYQLKGGRLGRLMNHPTAIAVYEGRDDRLMCIRQAGTLPSMPPDMKNVRNHYIYTRNGCTIMYSQFRRHFCLFISRLPQEVFLRRMGIEHEEKE